MSNLLFQSLAVGWTFALGVCRGGVTYRVTENADVCQEVHLGWMTPPQGTIADVVDSGHCRYEIRAGGENTLYVSASCEAHSWLPVRQKFAVDLSKRGNVTRISDSVWDSARPLPAGSGGIDPAKGARGVSYKDGPVLERSGPAWAGEGYNPVIVAKLDPEYQRVAVSSWDGFDIAYSFMDPTTALLKNKVTGRYWIDIYEAVSGRSLIRIEGTFKKYSPNSLLGSNSRWFGEYYVVVIGRDVDGGAAQMLQRFLICDTDAASRKTRPGLRQR